MPESAKHTSDTTHIGTKGKVLHIGGTETLDILQCEIRQPIVKVCESVTILIDQTTPIGEFEQCYPKLIDAEELVEELLSTSEGRELWAEAEEEYRAELREELEEGKVSKIKFHRLVADLSQVELANKAGIPQSNLARAEKVGYSASVKTYKKIAKALGVDYMELLP